MDNVAKDGSSSQDVSGTKGNLPPEPGGEPIEVFYRSTTQVGPVAVTFTVGRIKPHCGTWRTV